VQNKEILLIHMSAIVQSGLNSLIFNHQRISPKAIYSYTDLNILETIKKSVVFVDIMLDSIMMQYLSKLFSNENILVAVSGTDRKPDYKFPYTEIISLNDSDAAVYKKLDRIFPFVEVDVSKNILTKREKDILKHVAQGLSSQDIADKLFISRHTVITHRKNICNKLAIKTIPGLTLYALVNKVI
jgi:DNA-binding CsgD family transcriptional regulator